MSVTRAKDVARAKVVKDGQYAARVRYTGKATGLWEDCPRVLGLLGPKKEKQ